jgi:hypothetical protein
MRLLIGVGLLGGFTTFSAFSAELITMLHRGQAGMALGYAMQDRLPQARFRRWTQGLLVLTGLNLVRDGVTGLL